jgi:serine protease
MSSGDNSERYVYTMRTEDPCQVEIDLTGPEDANFDLRVTLDGRVPTPEDDDLSATTTNARENIVTDAVTAGQTISVLVERVSGVGRYELAIREHGR